MEVSSRGGAQPTEPSRFVEFQTVLLAHTSNGDIHPLLDSNTPKFMLPFANYPLISYPLHLLQYHGFNDIIIVVYEAYIEQMEEFLSSQYVKLDDNCRIIIRSVTEEDLGEIEVLQQIHQDIKTDFLVMRCDLITNASLKHLAMCHRTEDSSITLLLRNKDKMDKSKKTKRMSSSDQYSSHYIGTDPSLTSNDNRQNYYHIERLLCLRSAADITDNKKLTLSKLLLDQRPSMRITKALQIMEAGIFAHWVLLFMIEGAAAKSDMISLYEELVPNIIDRQFGLTPDDDDSDDDDDDNDHPSAPKSQPQKPILTILDGSLQQLGSIPNLIRKSSTIALPYPSPTIRPASIQAPTPNIDIPTVASDNSLSSSSTTAAIATMGNNLNTVPSTSATPVLGDIDSGASGGNSGGITPTNATTNSRITLPNSAVYPGAFYLSPFVKMVGSDYLLSSAARASLFRSSPKSGPIGAPIKRTTEDFVPITCAPTLGSVRSNLLLTDVHNTLPVQSDMSELGAANDRNTILRSQTSLTDNNDAEKITESDEIRVYGVCVSVRNRESNDSLKQSKNRKQRSMRDDSKDENKSNTNESTKIHCCEKVTSSDAYLKSCLQMLSFASYQSKRKKELQSLYSGNSDYTTIFNSDLDWDEKMFLYDDSGGDKSVDNLLWLSLLQSTLLIDKNPKQIWPHAYISAECLVDKTLDIGEQSTIKNSIIGKFCKIGKKSKLVNCVVMNHVTIGDDVKLTNVVVAGNGFVGNGCVLTNVTVGTKANVPKGERQKDGIVEAGMGGIEDAFDEDDVFDID